METFREEVERRIHDWKEDIFSPRLNDWWQTTTQKPYGLTVELVWESALPYARARAWWELLVTTEPQAPHQALARRALFREGIPAPIDEDLYRLCDALIPSLQELRDSLSMEAITIEQLLSPPLEEGMFWLDARAAQVFEKRGAHELAAVIRAQSITRLENYQGALSLAQGHSGRRAKLNASLWSLFDNDTLARENLPPLAVAVLLARALVKELGIRLDATKTEAPKEEHKPPPDPKEKTSPSDPKETVATVHLEVARLYSVAYVPKEVTLSEDHSSVLRDGEVLARVPSLPKRELALLHKGLHQVGNLTFRRAVNYLVRACWERHQAGETIPQLLTFSGADDLAERIGETSDKGTTALLSALAQGQHFSLSWPGGIIGGLWTYYYQRAWTGRKAVLEVELSRVLRPHYGMSQLESPWRVPVVQLAPMVGRHNEYAAQAALQERLLIELVERRVELLKYGGAKILLPEWRRFAQEVGLPTKTIPALLERWQHTADDGEAFLEKNGDHYLLATTKPYRSGREFLLEAARRTLQAKEAGKKAVVLQLQKLQRHTPTPKKK